MPILGELDEDSGISGYASGEDSSSGKDQHQETAKNTNATKNDSNDQKQLEKTLAAQETKAVGILRVAALLVLIAAAVLACTVVYLFMKRAEEDDFDNHYYDLATRLIDGFHANARLRVQVMDMLALSLTSHALASNQTWPFVTFPDFEARATAARVLVNSDYVGLYPIVTQETRRDYELFVAEQVEWLNESYAYQREFKETHGRTVGARAPALERRSLRRAFRDEYMYSSSYNNNDGRYLQENVTITESVFDGPQGMTQTLYRYGTEEEGVLFVVDESPGPYYPMNQVSPAREGSVLDLLYNFNDPFYPDAFLEALSLPKKTGTAVFAGVWNVFEDGTIDENDDYDFRTVPAASLFYPIFDTIMGNNKEVVAFFDLDLEFGPLFSSVLPPGDANRVVAVVSNCDQTFSYLVDGQSSSYLGYDDLHDPEFDSMKVSALLTDFDNDDVVATSAIYNGVPVNKDFCPWKVDVYATKEMEDEFLTSKPIYYLCAVLAVFLFTSLVFVVYDRIVEQRQRKVMKTAVTSDKLVASFFPTKALREQLYEAENKKDKHSSDGANNNAFSAEFQSDVSREFLVGGGKFLSKNMPISNSPPMAELYPDCSVFFADIAGFTSWSSARSPAEVFTLLETLYGAFDKLAKRHKIFKIETIGDCYVAATGLPEKQQDHAVLMIKFARGALQRFAKLVQHMEATLGPETANLALRVGIHSGPVTAGVLRGEKARFQLFGDTVNTCARMESNGMPGRIHISEETYNALVAAGKDNWATARAEKITAKGKGELQTYWVHNSTGAGSISTRSHISSDESSQGGDDDAVEVEMAISELPGTDEFKTEFCENNHRRIEFVADLLGKELVNTIAERGELSVQESAERIWASKDHTLVNEINWDDDLSTSLFSHGVADGANKDFKGLSLNVERQLFELVSRIAFTYKDVPYHNFEHSCNVIMQCSKMLQSLTNCGEQRVVLKGWAKFAVLFSLLIRDLDRSGVQKSAQNENSAEERPRFNSITAAWTLLDDARLKDLQDAMCASNDELRRFWKLVANMVLGSDSTSDKSINAAREVRWLKAFASGPKTDNLHEKVISVIEHILLAAKETHALQFWENYVRWSNRFYKELHEVFEQGGIAEDPYLQRYKREKEYFDGFLVPLASKINHEGVLGALGKDYYKYACQNQQEWAISGQDTLVMNMYSQDEKTIDC